LSIKIEDIVFNMKRIENEETQEKKEPLDLSKFKNPFVQYLVKKFVKYVHVEINNTNVNVEHVIFFILKNCRFLRIFHWKFSKRKFKFFHQNLMKKQKEEFL
jgi:hypothetical protein